MSRRWLGTAVLAAAMLSCQVILGLKDPGPGNDPPPEAGPTVDPCTHARPPPPPAQDDDTTTKNSFWLATQGVVIPLKADAGVQPGFDLDNSCTCEPDLRDGSASCSTAASRPAFCDYPNGVDDALGKIATSFIIPIPGYDPIAEINRQFLTGARTLLTYITAYNDKANDSEVGISFVGSGGLYSNLGCDGNARADEPVTFGDPDAGGLPDIRYRPAFDGCDRWSPDVGVTRGQFPSRAPFITLAAYVTNFTLVVQIQQGGVPLFGSESMVTNSIVVGQLTKDANGLHHLDGTIAGRFGFADFINLIGRTPISNAGPDGGPAAFCTQPYWSIIVPKLCDARDIMLSPAEDFQDKACDATSMTVGFSSVEAQVSDIEFTQPANSVSCDVSSTCP